MTMSDVLGLYNYWIVIFLMMTGFYTVISRGNLVKKIIGLNIFQTSVFLLYITIGKVRGGTAPIVIDTHGAHGADATGHAAEAVIYSNPLPSVLILTAIVVGVATTAVALSLVIRIHESYGTIEEDELQKLESDI